MSDPSFDPTYLKHLHALEDAYLQTEDPLRQSGFGGGIERWRDEREPLLVAIEGNGEVLDLGCANGYLLECLRGWAAERDITLVPFGLDLGERLIELARARFPGLEDHFYVGNAWTWDPPHKFRYVFTLYDCAPLELLSDYLSRLLARAVAPGGRLIVGAYGSRSRGIPAFKVEAFLLEQGFQVAGVASGGNPIQSRFAWVTKL